MMKSPSNIYCRWVSGMDFVLSLQRRSTSKPDMSPGGLTSVGRKTDIQQWLLRRDGFVLLRGLFDLCSFKHCLVWYVSFLTPDSWMKKCFLGKMEHERRSGWGVMFPAHWCNWIIKFDYSTQRNLHVCVVIMSIQLRTHQHQLFVNWKSSNHNRVG